MKKLRLTRFKRAEPAQLPGFRLTRRDLELLQIVSDFRLLTSRHIQVLMLDSGRGGRLNSRLQYRLQMLYHYGYLFRDEQPQKLTEGRKPLVYGLEAKGAQLLADRSDRTQETLQWDERLNNVSSPFLEHLLSTNDVRVAIALAARRHGFTILEWLDDKTLKSRQMKDYVTITGPDGGSHKAAVVPDGYFHLQTPTDHFNYLLEVDRCTVTGEATKWGRRDWARKVRAYLAYYSQGKYQKRYQTADMRVLTVTTGEKRLSNLKAVTEHAGGRGRFWFTTFDAVQAGDVFKDSIWQVAGRLDCHCLIHQST